ncbi:MAG: DUF167 domain-containing protein [Lentisphaeria bacterium]|nr:DUF167 domain-containing protein [Lentisphaeria bacterium]
MTVETLAPLIRTNGSGVFLSCHVQPGAKRTAVSGVYGTSLKIALAAPPVDGKANKELCVFLAKKLGLAKSAVTLVSGQTSRDKVVFLPGVAPGQLAVALE